MGLVHTVGLVLHPERDSVPAITTVMGWAERRDVTVLGLPDEIGRIACAAVPVAPNELADRADLVVSLGGDGTMLRSMRLIAGRSTPVLGVNLGRLGFLAEIDVDTLPAALSAIDNHHYSVEPRLAVRATMPDGRAVTAFNDIALVRIPGDGLAAIAIEMQEQPFVRYAADAVIVATPTGSTAYSFSAGGPIVAPTVRAMLVTAAAAHSTFNRALMLPTDERLCLRLLPTCGRLAVEVDGRLDGYVCAGDRVTVTAHADAAQVVRLGHGTFYERARRKLQVRGSLEVD
ncbi:NAD(+)/NADH kinase [Catellatospora sp. KI3]|uniref:NAD(+)/NADH kinase n=1 Tax=Catellatospora sp. KI3 TaxID=3041620 RepID=UPI00248231CE|nr:NAD(+)/NADH kinase [Catellatospora sp. KI3]MDI1466001.1 NAD(+)/NADH kinase [Catellatospora sp. KI3]